MGIESTDLEKALTQKGFSREQGKKDHRWYRLFVNGKATSIRTKISHGPKYTLSDKLVSVTWKQMCLRKKNDLIEFVACSLTEEEYILILKQSKKIIINKDLN